MMSINRWQWIAIMIMLLTCLGCLPSSLLAKTTVMNDSMDASALLVKGEAAFKQKNYRQSIEYYVMALAAEKKQPLPTTKASLSLRYKLHYQLAIVYLFTNKPAQAVATQKKGYELDETSIQAIKEYALVLKLAGGVYFQQDKHAQAIVYYQQSLTLNKKAKDDKEIDSVLAALSLTSMHNNEGDAAEKYSLQLVKHRKKYLPANAIAIIKALMSLNSVYFDQTKRAASKKLLNEIVAYAKKHRPNDTKTQIDLMHQLAIINKSLADYETAENHAQQALNLLEQYDPENLVAIAENKVTLASIFSLRYELDKAEVLFKAALEHYEQLNLKSMLSKMEHYTINAAISVALNNLSLVYKTQGDYAGVIKGVGNTSFMQHVNFSNNSPTPHSL